MSTREVGLNRGSRRLLCAACTLSQTRMIPFFRLTTMTFFPWKYAIYRRLHLHIAAAIWISNCAKLRPTLSYHSTEIGFPLMLWCESLVMQRGRLEATDTIPPLLKRYRIWILMKHIVQKVPRNAFPRRPTDPSKPVRPSVVVCNSNSSWSAHFDHLDGRLVMFSLDLERERLPAAQ